MMEQVKQEPRNGDGLELGSDDFPLKFDYHAVKALVDAAIAYRDIDSADRTMHPWPAYSAKVASIELQLLSAALNLK